MSRFLTLEQLLADETPELRAEIKARSRELIKAERLRQLRALARKKQDEVAGMRQDGVSRLERRSDMLISSLNTYVRGLGGRLRIVAELPGVGDVDLQITRQGKVEGATARVLKSVDPDSGKPAKVTRLKAARSRSPAKKAS
ncbi:MAG: hypothetical protein HY834_05145 [Devosia nanyangense]|uniref:Uncharacterized protein n=1 Tax=Devosia nanyangense TaxID=1228055 RepID=A0A933NXY4_9HYPH|nr:hypothetical protein [Devosia nanyangense]